MREFQTERSTDPYCAGVRPRSWSRRASARGAGIFLLQNHGSDRRRYTYQSDINTTNFARYTLGEPLQFCIHYSDGHNSHPGMPLRTLLPPIYSATQSDGRSSNPDMPSIFSFSAYVYIYKGSPAPMLRVGQGSTSTCSIQESIERNHDTTHTKNILRVQYVK